MNRRELIRISAGVALGGALFPKVSEVLWCKSLPSIEDLRRTMKVDEWFYNKPRTYRVFYSSPLAGTMVAFHVPEEAYRKESVDMKERRLYIAALHIRASEEERKA